MRHDWRWLVERLRDQGFRLTRQRGWILHALCAADSHLSAEEVHERVQTGFQSVDLSTVYRALETLRDLRLVSETDLGRGCLEYEIVDDPPHHHLVCLACGRLIHLPHNYFQGVETAIRQGVGFEPVIDHFAIYGLCRSCAAERRADSVLDQQGPTSDS